jgi:hypothetical protein
MNRIGMVFAECKSISRVVLAPRAILHMASWHILRSGGNMVVSPVVVVDLTTATISLLCTVVEGSECQLHHMRHTLYYR